MSALGQVSQCYGWLRNSLWKLQNNCSKRVAYSKSEETNISLQVSQPQEHHRFSDEIQSQKWNATGLMLTGFLF